MRKQKMRKVAYVRTWNLNEGEKIVGSLTELAIDYPRFFFRLDQGRIGLIPPFEATETFFKLGGTHGGMSPGATWKGFSISQEEYDFLVTELMKLSHEELKDNHPYIPEYIRIDFDLNEKYKELSIWRKEAKRKYMGVNEMSQFLDISLSYPIKTNNKQIGKVKIFRIKRGSKCFATFTPLEGFRPEELKNIFDRGDNVLVRDYWDVWQPLKSLEVLEDMKIEFVTEFQKIPPYANPKDLL